MNMLVGRTGGRHTECACYNQGRRHTECACYNQVRRHTECACYKEAKDCCDAIQATVLALAYDFCHNVGGSANSDHVVPVSPRGLQQMNDEEYLAQITIPVPCPQEWRRMPGDNRTRHCDLCGKSVYNLAAMTSDEVVALIKKNDGEFCGRGTRRPDVSPPTSDRSPKRSQRLNPWQLKISSVMGLIAALAHRARVFAFRNGALSDTRRGADQRYL